MFSGEYSTTFRITCFEEHLRKAASTRCYSDTINLTQSSSCATYSFKILVSERKYINNLKNCESRKKKQQQQQQQQFSYTVYNIYVIIYNGTPWFYQDFKSGNPRFL